MDRQTEFQQKTELLVAPKCGRRTATKNGALDSPFKWLRKICSCEWDEFIGAICCWFAIRWYLMRTYVFFLIMCFIQQCFRIQTLDLPVDLDRLSESQRKIVLEAENNDPSALLSLGKALLGSSVFGPPNASLALQYFSRAAELGDPRAQYNLGVIYAEGTGGEEASHPLALYWFRKAAQQKHQGAIYNCGLLLSEEDPISALEFFQRAFMTGTPTSASYYANYSSQKTTEVSRSAHFVICRMISSLSIFSIDYLHRVWNASTLLLSPLSESAASFKQWTAAVSDLSTFNDSFRQSGTLDETSRRHMQAASDSLSVLLTQPYASHLSQMQEYLVLDSLQDVIGPMAGKDDAYARVAGTYAEQLARNDYCMSRAAQSESMAACFNGAVSSAVSYYRRAKDKVKTMRAFLLGSSHGIGTTSWRHLVQTPRVFHPLLRASPWWRSSDFSLAKELQTMLSGNRRVFAEQLDAMIALRDGGLGSRSRDSPTIPTPAATEDASTKAGFKHIFTPYIGVRADNQDAYAHDASGWAEFGPLYSGLEWDAEKCAMLPLLCMTLQNHRGGEICSFQGEGTASSPHTAFSYRDVEEQCGSPDTIITILRLRPGTQILPHCGTTNRRLIMHFTLRGARGVQFRVGDDDDPSDDYDEDVTEGRHSTGKRDEPMTRREKRRAGEKRMSWATASAPQSSQRVIVNLMGGSQQQQGASPFSTFQVIHNDKYKNSNHSGWISSYRLVEELEGEEEEPGASREDEYDGRAIVFDDSFEHEVHHQGTRDRYVLLVVLKHPDVRYELGE